MYIRRTTTSSSHTLTYPRTYLRTNLPLGVVG